MVATQLNNLSPSGNAEMPRSLLIINVISSCCKRLLTWKCKLFQFSSIKKVNALFDDNPI